MAELRSPRQREQITSGNAKFEALAVALIKISLFDDMISHGLVRSRQGSGGSLRRLESLI